MKNYNVVGQKSGTKNTKSTFFGTLENFETKFQKYDWKTVSESGISRHTNEK